MRPAYSVCMLLFLLFSGMAAAEEAPRVEMLHMWRTDSEQHALGAFRDPLIADGVDWYDYATDNNFQGVQTEFSNRLSLDDPPTAVQWIVGEEMRRLASGDAIRRIPLTQEISKRLHPEVIELVEVQGELAGIPVGIHTQNHIVYNRRAAEKLGVQIPESWDDLISLGDVFSENGIYLIAASNQEWQLRVLFNAILSSTLTADEFRSVMTPQANVEHLIPKFRAAFSIFAQLKKFADPNDEDRRWEDVTKAVAEEKAFAQILGDYIVPEFPDRGAIVCKRSPGANYIIWGMDSFVLPETNDQSVRIGQDKLVNAILSPENSAEYISRKGGVPVTRDADLSRLGPCSLAVTESWDRIENRIWTGGDVWRHRFSAMAAVAKREWDNEQIDPEAAAKILASVLGAI